VRNIVLCFYMYTDYVHAGQVFWRSGIWILDGQPLATGLTIIVVLALAVDGEVGRLVDKRSGLGVGTGGGGSPEATAEVDHSELVKILSRDLS
jgi:hypothetical protein